MSPAILLLLFLVGCSEACNRLDRGLTDREKNYLLRRHNELRSQVAMGSQSGLPSASNMKEMVWDEAVADSAQAWADYCTFSHGQASSVGEYMGQNLAWTGGGKMNLEHQMNNFYDEVALFNPQEINDFRTAGEVGHFTQLIWADSYRLGCGKIVYDNGSGHEEVLVCNYAPGGNYVGSSIYQPGSPCSKCARGCSSSYRGLCVP